MIAGQESVSIPLCGLWENISKKGDRYLSGSLGNAKIMVFKNKKTTDKQPDYRVVLFPVQRKEPEKPQEIEDSIEF